MPHGYRWHALPVLNRRPTIRRLESKAAMGPKTIVMIDKYSERSHEVPCVQDQQPVQAFSPNRPNEPLRDPIRLRGLNRRTNNARALRLKDDIETARELSIMVANQESDWVSTLEERPCDVPRLLRHPFAVGIRRAAGQVHATTGDFDEGHTTAGARRCRR